MTTLRINVEVQEGTNQYFKDVTFNLDMLLQTPDIKEIIQYATWNLAVEVADHAGYSIGEKE